MLLGVQQIALLITIDNIPVLQAIIVVGDELEAPFSYAIRTGLRKPRKRCDNLAILTDNALVGKAPPFEAAAIQCQHVAFVGGAGRLVNAFVTGAASNKQSGSNQQGSRKNHGYESPGTNSGASLT